jgi:aldehyde dehydrogenase (NAD+)
MFSTYNPTHNALTHAKSIRVSPPDVAIDHLLLPYTMEKVQALNQWFDY